MTTDQTSAAEKAEIMLAFSRGAKIQCRDALLPSMSWLLASLPCWDWVRFTYRIAPDPYSPDVVRPQWEAMTPTDQPGVREKDGKRFRLRWRHQIDGSIWIYNPSPDHTNGKYEIVPLPERKFRPWTWEEAEENVGSLVRHKLNKSVHVITAAAYNDVGIGGLHSRSREQVLTDFEQLDHSPCGTEIGGAE